MSVPAEKRLERPTPFVSAWQLGAAAQGPLLRELSVKDVAEAVAPVAESAEITADHVDRVSRNVFNGNHKNPQEVPVDDMGIVQPEHYFVFIDGEVPKKYRTRQEMDDNWQHMVYPTFMHNSMPLAHHLYGDKGFTDQDESKLAIYRGLPYNQVKLPFYMHVHYHHVHEDYVPPPSNIDVLDRFIEESATLTALGAVSLAKCDVGNMQGHADVHHEELYDMYARDQERLIREVGKIEVVPWLTVKSAVARMTDIAPDPVLLEFDESINGDGSNTLPIRIPSTRYMRNIYIRRYRAEIPEAA